MPVQGDLPRFDVAKNLALMLGSQFEVEAIGKEVGHNECHSNKY